MQWQGLARQGCILECSGDSEVSQGAGGPVGPAVSGQPVAFTLCKTRGIKGF